MTTTNFMEKATSNGASWTDRTTLKMITEDLGLSLEDCSFWSPDTSKCPAGQSMEEMYKKPKDHPDYFKGAFMDFIMFASQIKPELIVTTCPHLYDFISKTKLSGGIGKRKGITHRFTWGAGADAVMVAATCPNVALYSDSTRNQFIADVRAGMAATNPRAPSEYTWVEDPEQLIKLTDNIIEMSRNGALPVANMVAIDTETNPKIAIKDNPATAYSADNNIATVQVCWEPGKAMTIPLIRGDSSFNNERNILVARNQIKRILDEVRVCGHNYRYDECYFITKLGLRTKNFAFDSMLAHHFMYSHLPMSLGFVTSRWLGWESHKKIIDDELKAMPEEVRSYALLSQEVIHQYGCLDADATLCVSDILMKKLEGREYSKFPEAKVVYNNSLEAFNGRVMFPWRAITEMEVMGAKFDIDRLPEVADSLKADMDKAEAKLRATPQHQKWVDSHSTKNPKAFKIPKKSMWFTVCEGCLSMSEKGYTAAEKKALPVQPTTCDNTACGGSLIWKRKMVADTTKDPIRVEGEPLTTEGALNIKSSKQLKEFLYDPKYMSFPTPPPSRDGGDGMSTDKAARTKMRKYADTRKLQGHMDVIDAIDDFNASSKLYSSYALKLGKFLWVGSEGPQTTGEVTDGFEDPLPRNFVHTNLLQQGTGSGRLSSRDPSLHTIPRSSDIKTLFTSRFGEDGLILQADLSQAEVRAFVIESDDENLKDSFIRGVDPYIGAAATVNGISEADVSKEQRQDAKSIILGLIYGRGSSSIAEQTGRTLAEAEELKNTFFGSFPKVAKYISDCHDFGRKYGIALSRFGRIRDISDDMFSDDGGKVKHAENVSGNHPIQSLVGDLGIDCVARIFYRMSSTVINGKPMRSVLFNTVHDSTILDIYIPELLEVMKIVNEELYSKLPEYYPWINIPFTIDFDLGTSWGTSVGASYEGSDLTLSGKHATISAIGGKMKKFYDLKSKNVEADPESGKVTLTWDLA